MGKKKALIGVMEYKEYENQLNEEEKDWVEQFYKEYYANGRHNEETPILKSREHIREAHRNYNSLYRDAFNLSQTLGKQKDLSESEREIYELAADETEWETAFKQQGPEFAADIIMAQAIRDIKARQDMRVVLSRFYVKMCNFKKQFAKEKRKK